MEQAMTRAERRAEQRAHEARIAVWVWARLAAKREVKARIRAEGFRLCEFTGRELTLRAEALVRDRPEFITQAWARAKEEFGLDQVA
jgi:hypothetical protein